MPQSSTTRSATAPLRRVYLDRNLQINFGVTLMAILSVSSIIPALPLMVSHFAIGKAEVGLIVTAFTLPGILAAPLGGILADRFGRKQVLVPCLFVFAAFGTACFFAQDMATLLVLRFFQGLGAGPVSNINVTIIGDLYDGRERAAAMGYNGSVLSIGTAAFPALGGMLAMVGWQYPFLLPALAVPLGLVVAFGLKTPEVKSSENFGTYLKTAARQMRKPRALSLFGVSLVTFIVLYGGIVTYLPVLLHDRFGSSPAAIGWIVAASSGVTALAASQLGRLTRWLRPGQMMLAAFAFYALAMLMVPLMPTAAWCILPICFFGLAQGLNVPNLLTILSGLADTRHRAAFMAINGMVLRLGQTLGPVVMGVAYALGGLWAVYSTAASLALVMLALALWGGHHRKHLKKHG